MAAFTLQQYPIIIPILNNIGQLQYRRGDISLARETYTTTLECAQLIYGKKHPHVATALNCLGVLHYHERNLKKQKSILRSGQQRTTTFFKTIVKYRKGLRAHKTFKTQMTSSIRKIISSVLVISAT